MVYCTEIDRTSLCTSLYVINKVLNIELAYKNSALALVRSAFQYLADYPHTPVIKNQYVAYLHLP